MTIVCGTDFSERSIAACEVAALIAAAHREPLLLVHAVASVSTPPAYESGHALDDLASSAERALHDLATRLASHDVEVSTSVRIGAADEVLLEEVEKSGARMIVLASVGARGLRVLLGSTSDRIASRTPVPLFVVRDDFPAAAWLRDRKPLRVAVAADLGPSTDTAVEWASQLPERAPCEFVAMHVSWPPGDSSSLAVDAPMHLDRTHPLVEQVIRRELDRVAARLQGSSETKSVMESNAGRTGAAIAQVARREAADLLVVGRGREEGRHWWERSVSREVIREAPMSIVCVPESGDTAATVAPQVRRILAATDFSPLGNAAVIYAKGLLPHDGELMVVHVMVDDAANGDREAARNQLEALVTDLPEERVVVELLSGHDPGGLISAAAERFAADVICVGSRGRAALTKAMLGSVAQNILLATARPVLMVPSVP